MNTVARPRLKFHSKPSKHRFAHLFTAAILLLGWTVYPLVLVMTYFSVQQDLSTGFAAILVAIAFTLCMTIGTRQYLKISTSDGFELLIESDVLFLYGLDKLKNRRLSDEIALSQVEEADYYPMSEYATLVLHSHGKRDVEVPLWAFGKHAEQRIVEYIKSRTRVIDIPSAIVV